jgi:hypothetical protein
MMEPRRVVQGNKVSEAGFARLATVERPGPRKTGKNVVTACGDPDDGGGTAT